MKPQEAHSELQREPEKQPPKPHRPSATRRNEGAKTCRGTLIKFNRSNQRSLQMPQQGLPSSVTIPIAWPQNCRWKRSQWTQGSAMALTASAADLLHFLSTTPCWSDRCRREVATDHHSLEPAGRSRAWNALHFRSRPSIAGTKNPPAEGRGNKTITMNGRPGGLPARMSDQSDQDQPALACDST